MESKTYLDYLDKEMTIMGLLSAFSLGCSVLLVEKVAGAEKGVLHGIWIAEQPQILLAVASFVIAALFFYRQRSHLAWLFGQITLNQALETSAAEMKSQLKEADTWRAWLHYRSAFVLLIVAFAQLGFATIDFVGIYQAPVKDEAIKPIMHPAYYYWALPTLATAFCLLQAHVMIKYNERDRPWRAFLLSDKDKRQPGSASTQ